MPRPKVPIYVRFDDDVVKYFKKKGKRYQSRINAVLRAYVDRHTKRKNQQRKVG